MHAIGNKRCSSGSPGVAQQGNRCIKLQMVSSSQPVSICKLRMGHSKNQIFVLLACLLLNSALSWWAICVEVMILISDVQVSAADAGVVKINTVSLRCPGKAAVCCSWQLLCTTSMQWQPIQVQQMQADLLTYLTAKSSRC